MTREQFNEMFWLHFPPEVRALRPMIEAASHDESKDVDVQAEAVRLALAGYTIDPRIMTGQNIDPYTAIALRIEDGYTWYPALLEERNFDLAPGLPAGLGAAGVSARPYDPDNPTRRFIPASLDPADWPSFEPPQVVHEPIPTVPAAPDWAHVYPGGVAAVRIGDRSPVGTRSSSAMGEWVKVAEPSLAGVSVFWRRQ